jgi:hypothetical protein
MEVIHARPGCALRGPSPRRPLGIQAVGDQAPLRYGFLVHSVGPGVGHGCISRDGRTSLLETGEIARSGMHILHNLERVKLIHISYFVYKIFLGRIRDSWSGGGRSQGADDRNRTGCPLALFGRLLGSFRDSRSRPELAVLTPYSAGISVMASEPKTGSGTILRRHTCALISAGGRALRTCRLAGGCTFAGKRSRVLKPAQTTRSSLVHDRERVDRDSRDRDALFRRMCRSSRMGRLHRFSVDRHAVPGPAYGSTRRDRVTMRKDPRSGGSAGAEAPVLSRGAQSLSPTGTRLTATWSL